MKLLNLPLVVVVLAMGTAQAADKPTKAVPVDTQQLVQLNATATQILKAVLDLKGTVAAGHDPTLFCYLADKRYSEGTVAEGRECRRRPTGDVFAGDEQPLTWQRPGRDPQITQ